MPHGPDKRSCNVRWVSASEPFTLSPVQLRGSSLHAGERGGPWRSGSPCFCGTWIHSLPGRMGEAGGPTGKAGLSGVGWRSACWWFMRTLQKIPLDGPAQRTSRPPWPGEELIAQSSMQRALHSLLESTAALECMHCMVAALPDGEAHKLSSQATWAPILALSPMNHVSSDRLLSLSGPQFTYSQNGYNDSAHPMALL